MNTINNLNSGVGDDCKNSKSDLKLDKTANSPSKLNSWIIPAKKCYETGEAPNSKHEFKCDSPKNPRLSQTGALNNPNRTQYIKKKAQIKKNIDQLNYSARFTFVNMEIRLHSEGSIMTTEHNFIAAVKLEHPEQLDECSDFEQAKQVLIEQLRIVRIYRDGLREPSKVPFRNLRLVKNMPTIIYSQ